jgi:hypothetical protein
MASTESVPLAFRLAPTFGTDALTRDPPIQHLVADGRPRADRLHPEKDKWRPLITVALDEHPLAEIQLCSDGKNPNLRRPVSLYARLCSVPCII